MRKIIILCAALTLGACTTAQIEQGKEIARASIDVICTAYPPAHFAFLQLAATGRIDPRTVENERLAVVSLEALCTDPPKDAKTAIATASRVFTALLTAAADARRQLGGA